THDLILILNRDFVIVGVSDAFCGHFEVTRKEVLGKSIYDLENGEWNIPGISKLLEDFLRFKSPLKNIQVSHDFSKIGKRVMLINAKRFDSTKDIVLSIEDITIKKAIDRKLSRYNKEIEKGAQKRTRELEVRIDELERLNKIMTGREMKMIELKKELIDLKSSNLT
ncbi:PAS domain-containing protein, partial [Patescibacteria group bacterium]